ncbi:MAG: o-succinylbenzoate synthase [Bacteroidia bacterium]|nr:o-succinylbenzoate synthase [Bacteroidia bacterium]NNK60770.1 o-succinylbenzoate synthase [Flavobacteriaceae bacterium]NNL33539.1 o-succinylbenzoate synthase [Flavobacteriaceae bacterium]RZW53957.1 MAG: o-succinylbenzoate synthase [Flavobacteriaceae bacterium]
MTASYKKFILNFKKPSGTSRGVLTEKETWFILLSHNGKQGIGECGLLRGLSIDDVPEYEEKMRWTCQNISLGLAKLYQELSSFPSIQFGLEMAYKSLENDNQFVLFPSKFTSGKDEIPINGLIWMGDVQDMKMQVREKIEQGFSCIKMKIGAIDFNSEIAVLKRLRQEYSESDIEIRVDANGAFHPSEALDKLKQLSEFKLHSIEQPIKPRQYEKMAMLCETSPLPIALDEELIGVFGLMEKQELIQSIKPQYIILKPSFVGGFKGSLEWIALAEDNQIKWWITSALESNIGLNAIAQWTYTLKNNMHQGLGTGGLFTNNFLSPLQVKNGNLRYESQIEWNLNTLDL